MRSMAAAVVVAPRGGGDMATVSDEPLKRPTHIPKLSFEGLHRECARTPCADSATQQAAEKPTIAFQGSGPLQDSGEDSDDTEERGPPSVQLSRTGDSASWIAWLAASGPEAVAARPARVPQLALAGIRPSLQGCVLLGAPPPEEPGYAHQVSWSKSWELATGRTSSRSSKSYDNMGPHTPTTGTDSEPQDSSREPSGRGSSGAAVGDAAYGTAASAIPSVQASKKPPPLPAPGAPVPKLSFSSLRHSPRGLRTSPRGPRLHSPRTIIHTSPRLRHTAIATDATILEEPAQTSTACDVHGHQSSDFDSVVVHSNSRSDRAAVTTAPVLDEIGDASNSSCPSSCSQSQRSSYRSSSKPSAVPVLSLQGIRPAVQGCFLIGCPPPEELFLQAQFTKGRLGAAALQARGRSGQADAVLQAWFEPNHQQPVPSVHIQEPYLNSCERLQSDCFMPTSAACADELQCPDSAVKDVCAARPAARLGPTAVQGVKADVKVCAAADPSCCSCFAGLLPAYEK
eukprot:TRINITY_DN49962_c0_g1_i1.p1 TRINITY_DN49962_c0_g1~~TRINITY_DN49962_c0_g1_i1.p1  ORF type:complete len:513 (-),score=81.01 TRINITY_DN49962_c0_g1_i1:137-1675(-)